MAFQTEIAATIGVIVCSAIAGGWIFQRNKAKEDNKEPAHASLRFIKLNTRENVVIFTEGLPPVSAVTWFEGDAESAVDVLKERMIRIIKLNPWVDGRFVRIGSAYYITYDDLTEDSDEAKAQEAVQKIFTGPNDHKITPNVSIDMKIDDLGLASGTLRLKNGNEMHQPFWKISIARCAKSPETRFGVFVSMSHVFGDGGTFYLFHNMLLGQNIDKNKIRPLKGERVPNSIETFQELVNKVEPSGPFDAGLGMTAILGLVLEFFVKLFGWKVQRSSTVFIVDRDEIDSIKAASETDDDAPFVSTNDIISSWFLQTSCCAHGLVTVNTRKYLPDHTDDHAGNYLCTIGYRIPEDISKPIFIRKSLKNLHRVNTLVERLSFLGLLVGRIASCTNWATFATDCDSGPIDLIPDCKELLHIPVNTENLASPITMPTCVMFRARPGKIGVIVNDAAINGTIPNYSASFASEEPLY